MLAKVLSRFNNIILARVFGHADVVELAEFATVPGQSVTSFSSADADALDCARDNDHTPRLILQ
jgi:hypothetical protein